MKNMQKLTGDQELYLKKVLTQLEEGGLPKQPANKVNLDISLLREQ